MHWQAEQWCKHHSTFIQHSDSQSVWRIRYAVHQNNVFFMCVLTRQSIQCDKQIHKAKRSLSYDCICKPIDFSFWLEYFVFKHWHAELFIYSINSNNNKNDNNNTTVKLNSKFLTRWNCRSALCMYGLLTVHYLRIRYSKSAHQPVGCGSQMWLWHPHMYHSYYSGPLCPSLLKQGWCIEILKGWNFVTVGQISKKCWMRTETFLYIQFQVKRTWRRRKCKFQWERGIIRRKNKASVVTTGRLCPHNADAVNYLL